jgi:hypothetical protein
MSYALTHLSGFGGRWSSGNDAFTVALLKCDGADGSTTVANQALGGSTAFTAANGCQIDTDFFQFGGAALLFDGSNDTLSFDGSGADWTWAGDFAVDLWVRPTSKLLEGGAVRRLMNFGTGSTNFQAWLSNASGAVIVATGDGTVLITGTTDIATSTWRHVAITRSGTSLRLFVNGVQEGSTATNSTTWAGNATSYFGRYQGSAIGHYVGSMDEIRVSKGAARWVANFTPPGTPY